MKIDDITWDEIIEQTKAGIARWRKSAAEKNLPDHFTAKIEKGEKHILLWTEHNHGPYTDRKAVAREIATATSARLRL